MPPILALTLCTIFVVWLLTLDRKSSPENSIALWVPTSWFFLITGKPLGEWFPSPRPEGEMGSPLDRNFLISLMILGMIILVRRRFAVFKAIRDNSWLIFLAGFMLLSTLWSNIFVTSLTRWIREILTALIMSFLVLSEHNPRNAVLSILRRTIYIGIPFSLLLIKYFPLLGVQYSRWEGELMWVGVTTQKNGLGLLCLFAIFLILLSLIERREDRSILAVKYQAVAEIILLILSLHVLRGPSIYAMSATSATTLAIGVGIFFVFWRMRKSGIYPDWHYLPAIIVAGVMFGTLGVLKEGEPLGFLTSYVGRDSTLTGRTEIWLQFLPMAKQRLFLGHGFGGFWTAETIAYQGVNSVHNGYLEVILHLGFVGLILVSVFLVSSCRRAQGIMKWDFYGASLWLGLLLMTILHNMGESSLDSFSRPLTGMLVLLYVAFSPIIKDHKKSDGDDLSEG